MSVPETRPAVRTLFDLLVGELGVLLFASRYPCGVGPSCLRQILPSAGPVEPWFAVLHRRGLLVPERPGDSWSAAARARALVAGQAGWVCDLLDDGAGGVRAAAEAYRHRFRVDGGAHGPLN